MTQLVPRVFGLPVQVEEQRWCRLAPPSGVDDAFNQTNDPARPCINKANVLVGTKDEWVVRFEVAAPEGVAVEAVVNVWRYQPPKKALSADYAPRIFRLAVMKVDSGYYVAFIAVSVPEWEPLRVDGTMRRQIMPRRPAA